jgi:hypothetical protein
MADPQALTRAARPIAKPGVCPARALLCSIAARIALAVVILSATPATAPAQTLSAQELSQICDELLAAELPLSDSTNTLSAKPRPLLFDQAATLRAFRDRGYFTGDSAAFRLSRPHRLPTRPITDDCDQETPMLCAAIGNAVYVTIEPVAVSTNRVVARVHVRFAARRSRPEVFLGDSSVFLSRLIGGGSEVVLLRRSGGRFVYSETISHYAI